MKVEVRDIVELAEDERESALTGARKMLAAFKLGATERLVIDPLDLCLLLYLVTERRRLRARVEELEAKLPS